MTYSSDEMLRIADAALAAGKKSALLSIIKFVAGLERDVRTDISQKGDHPALAERVRNLHTQALTLATVREALEGLLPLCEEKAQRAPGSSPSTPRL